MNCSQPGSSVPGISQVIMLDWVAISFSRGSSLPRDWTMASCISGGFFTAEPPGNPFKIHTWHFIAHGTGYIALALSLSSWFHWDILALKMFWMKHLCSAFFLLYETALRIANLLLQKINEILNYLEWIDPVLFPFNIGPYTFVQQHLMIGTDPRTILKDLLPETIPPPELDDMTLWQIVINILSEPPKRKKRKDINTIEDAVKLLQECKKIIVLTGAGVCKMDENTSTRGRVCIFSLVQVRNTFLV